MFNKFFIFLFLCQCFFSICADTQPMLIYNQFPRIWNMDFDKMRSYLHHIKEMGFNIVWVNPFFKVSNDIVVDRVDEYTGKDIRAKGSLYAMYDPSLTYGQEQQEQEGDPQGNDVSIDSRIRKYTDEAKALGLTPICDLVLNHVAKDSPLVQKDVSKQFTHFRDKGVDTSKWFKDDAEDKWDDVVRFNYNDSNRKEIFDNLWKPFITRLINNFGFSGVRIDFSTGVDPEILKMCIDHIKELLSQKNSEKKLVAFGESLIPASLNKHEILKKYKDVGFTNLTNLAIFLTDKTIKGGKQAGYEWFLSDLGEKRAVTHNDGEFRRGTIGFPGSHDNGTTLQAEVAESVTEAEVQSGSARFSIPENLWKSNKNRNELRKKAVRGKVIYEKLEAIGDIEKEFLTKKRVALAALSSDAGWYFFAGDEILSTITKSPFETEDKKAFGGESDEQSKLERLDINSSIPKFIKNINELFSHLRESEKEFWVEILYLDEERSGVCFVRHLIVDGKKSADVVVVKLRPNFTERSKTELVEFLRKWSEIKELPDWEKDEQIKWFYIGDNGTNLIK